jgi:hypothetical protein
MYETKYQSRSMNESYSSNASYELQNRMYEQAIKSSGMQGGEYQK